MLRCPAAARLHATAEAAYDPAEAALEDAVREASANVWKHRLNLPREREYQQQLREADAALQQYRCHRDPAAYERARLHDEALAADEYYFPPL